MGQISACPRFLFNIFNSNTFCLLKELAVPKFGSKTRINAFFHISPDVAQKYKIEIEYLKPFIKSPKDSNYIPIVDDEIEMRIFVCRKSKRSFIDWDIKVR